MRTQEIEDRRRAHLRTLSDEQLREAASMTVVVPLDAEIKAYAQDEMKRRGHAS